MQISEIKLTIEMKLYKINICSLKIKLKTKKVFLLIKFLMNNLIFSTKENSK